MIQSVYVLWLARNEARDGIQIAPPHEIMERVVHLLHEWRGIHQPTVKESGGQRRPKGRTEEEDGEEPSQNATVRPWARGGLRR